MYILKAGICTYLKLGYVRTHFRLITQSLRSVRTYNYVWYTTSVRGYGIDDTLWPLNVIDQRIYTNFIVTCCSVWLRLQICKLPPLNEGGATGLQLVASEFSFRLVPVIKITFIATIYDHWNSVSAFLNLFMTIPSMYNQSINQVHTSHDMC